MPLTMEWWNGQKNLSKHKVNGKVAPETDFEKKLKVYEAAQTALDKEHTIAHCDTAKTALTSLGTTLKPSQTVLNSKGFTELAKQLSLDNTIRKAGEDVQKIKDQLLSQQRIAKAGSHEEAVYEALWDGFEKLRATAKSAKIYKLMLTSPDKLEEQADKAGKSNDSLEHKYNQLSRGLAGIKNQVTQEYTNYHVAIQNAVHARQQVLPTFNQLTPTLQQAVQNLTHLKAQGLQYVGQRNTFLLNKVKGDAKIAADGAVQQFTHVTTPFAPGTPLRDGKDYKAHNIHADDVAHDIEPSFTALITVNKTNIGLKHNIETLAGDIAALKVT